MNCNIVTLDLLVDEGAVNKDNTARLDIVYELLEGWEVHSNEDVRICYQWGADLVLRDTYGAVSCTATHLRAVRWEPGELAAVDKCSISYYLTCKEDTLTAETGK